MHEGDAGRDRTPHDQERVGWKEATAPKPFSRLLRESGGLILGLIGLGMVFVPFAALGEPRQQETSLATYALFALVFCAGLAFCFLSIRLLWGAWVASEAEERSAAQKTLRSARRSAPKAIPGDSKGAFTSEAQPALLCEGRLTGLATYGFGPGRLILRGEVDPGIPRGWSGVAIYLLTLPLVLLTVGVLGVAIRQAVVEALFRKTMTLAIDKANVKRADFQTAKVTLWLREPIGKGIYGNIQKVAFVVAEDECEAFFSQFSAHLPGLLPKEYTSGSDAVISD